MGRISERITTTLQAPVKAQHMSGLALLISVIALGISFGILMGMRGASNGR